MQRGSYSMPQTLDAAGQAACGGSWEAWSVPQNTLTDAGVHGINSTADTNITSACLQPMQVCSTAYPSCSNPPVSTTQPRSTKSIHWQSLYTNHMFASSPAGLDFPDHAEALGRGPSDCAHRQGCSARGVEPTWPTTRCENRPGTDRNTSPSPTQAGAIRRSEMALHGVMTARSEGTRALVLRTPHPAAPSEHTPPQQQSLGPRSPANRPSRTSAAAAVLNAGAMISLVRGLVAKDPGSGPVAASPDPSEAEQEPRGSRARRSSLDSASAALRSAGLRNAGDSQRLGDATLAWTAAQLVLPGAAAAPAHSPPPLAGLVLGVTPQGAMPPQTKGSGSRQGSDAWALATMPWTPLTEPELAAAPHASKEETGRAGGHQLRGRASGVAVMEPRELEEGDGAAAAARYEGGGCCSDEGGADGGAGRRATGAQAEAGKAESYATRRAALLGMIKSRSEGAKSLAPRVLRPGAAGDPGQGQGCAGGGGVSVRRASSRTSPSMAGSVIRATRDLLASSRSLDPQADLHRGEAGRQVDAPGAAAGARAGAKAAVSLVATRLSLPGSLARSQGLGAADDAHSSGSGSSVSVTATLICSAVRQALDRQSGRAAAGATCHKGALASAGSVPGPARSGSEQGQGAPDVPLGKSGSAPVDPNQAADGAMRGGPRPAVPYTSRLSRLGTSIAMSTWTPGGSFWIDEEESEQPLDTQGDDGMMPSPFLRRSKSFTCLYYKAQVGNELDFSLVGESSCVPPPANKDLGLGTDGAFMLRSANHGQGGAGTGDGAGAVRGGAGERGARRPQHAGPVKAWSEGPAAMMRHLEPPAQHDALPPAGFGASRTSRGSGARSRGLGFGSWFRRTTPAGTPNEERASLNEERASPAAGLGPARKKSVPTPGTLTMSAKVKFVIELTRALLSDGKRRQTHGSAPQR